MAPARADAMRWSGLLLLAFTATACTAADDPGDDPWGDGKGDGYGAERQIDVVLTEPFCDVCTADDKTCCRRARRSSRGCVALIDGARDDASTSRTTRSACARSRTRSCARSSAASTSASRWTRARRLADTVATRLAAAGVDVRFVAGRRHARRACSTRSSCSSTSCTLATGSNNWSSTGTSINEESTIVDPVGRRRSGARRLRVSLRGDLEPTRRPRRARARPRRRSSRRAARRSKMIKEEIARAQKSIDVLMHHLVFDDLVKELAKAAERGVRGPRDRQRHRSRRAHRRGVEPAVRRGRQAPLQADQRRRCSSSCTTS